MLVPCSLHVPPQLIFQPWQQFRLLCPALLADLPLGQQGAAEDSVLLLVTGRRAEEVEKNKQAGPGEWLIHCGGRGGEQQHLCFRLYTLGQTSLCPSLVT